MEDSIRESGGAARRDNGGGRCVLKNEAAIGPETQVAFNLKKGSLPVRGDVDMSQISDCMKKGLEILAAGNTIPGVEQFITPDTQASLIDLSAAFLADESMSVEDAQSEFAQIISQAY